MGENTLENVSTWFSILDPYRNLAPTSAWNAHVLRLRLLTHSVNGVDPTSGLSPVHGFVALHCCYDHHPVVLRTLLELGSDADGRYLRPRAEVLADVPWELNGGTPLHFCAWMSRRYTAVLEVAKALLDAGVRLDAMTDGGKMAVDFCSDGSPLKELLVCFNLIRMALLSL
jgi:hypothetical protein